MKSSAGRCLTSALSAAADLIRKHAERVALCALPPADPRFPPVEALTLALGRRTFGDSAISLAACLRDIREVGLGGEHLADLVEHLAADVDDEPGVLGDGEEVTGIEESA